LQKDARYFRETYIKKPIRKGNVAVAEVHLQNGVSFGAGATSRERPISIPPPKSKGGQFEPTIDSRTQRIMDTDAEYKVLTIIAKTLEDIYELTISGNLYLYTELQPCESCKSIINQFEDKFPNITVQLFWELPYPP
jgi:hypothetical protein